MNEVDPVLAAAPTTYRLAWLNRLYASARNCSLNRSVSMKVLYTPKSRFQYPGPRNVLRPVMSLGYGGRSEKKYCGLVQWSNELAGGERKLNVFGVPVIGAGEVLPLTGTGEEKAAYGQ